MRCIPFLLAIVFIMSSSNGLAQDNPLLGFWQTEAKDGVVQFYKCDETYCGRFYWLQEDSLDDNNPDPEKRKRPLCGLTFLGGFKQTADSQFEDGWIYSPRHGANFSADLQIHNRDTLELRGYVFISLLGGSQTWTRVEHVEACPSMVKNDSL